MGAERRLECSSRSATTPGCSPPRQRLPGRRPRSASPRVSPGSCRIIAQEGRLASASEIHKVHEYNAPLKGPSGWSGGGLVPPWTYPGTIEPPDRTIFDQLGLYNSAAGARNASGWYMPCRLGWPCSRWQMADGKLRTLAAALASQR